MATTDRHSFLLWAAGFTQSDTLLNDLLLKLEVKLDASVISRTVTAQPATPTNGDMYIIPAGATGAQWAGFAANDITIFRDSTWYAFTPIAGWPAWVEDDAEGVIFDGTVWAVTLVANALVDADFAAAEGFMRKTGAGAYVAHKSNLTAIVAPTVTDDSAAGYSVGSIWLDTVAVLAYTCTSAAVGAAAWALGGLSEAQVDARVVAVASGKKSKWIPVNEMYVGPFNNPGAEVSIGTTGGARFPARPMDAAAVEYMAFNWVVPKSMDVSIGISAVFYWSPSTANAGSTAWNLWARALNDGDAIDIAHEAGNVTFQASNLTVNDIHITPESTPKVFTGIAAGSIMSFRCQRSATDATNDTYPDDANLIGVMMHYWTDAPTDA